MFDEKHTTDGFEDLMKSVLSDAQEEVPAYLWDGISERLDKIGTEKRRRPVVLFFKRTAAVVAAAAAIAVGVFLSVDRSRDTLVPEAEGSGLIAVIRDDGGFGAYGSIAEARLPKPQDLAISDRHRPATSAVQETAQPVAQATVPSDVLKTEPEAREAETLAPEDREAATATREYFSEIWPEDEVKKKKRAVTSVSFSGIVGTNNVETTSTIGPLRSPAISKTPLKTGISEKSSNSIYGLPLSFGAGVKIGLAPRWSLGTGVNYTLLTRKFFGTYTLVKDNTTKQTSSDIRNVQQYIGIPVNVFYNIMDRKNLNFYAYAGGAVERCISNKYKLLDTPVTHTETAKGVQLSANVGIGVEFLIGRHIGLYIDPRLSYYFKNGQPKSIRTDQPLIMEFEMGLRWRFAREY